MRIFITVLVLILSLQSITKADDIRDFQIEGMSIGDNLFNFITKKEFENASKDSRIHYHKDNKFAELLFYKLQKFKTYDGVRVIWKPKDKDYKLYGISGVVYFRNNFQDCENKKKTIVNEISKFFVETKKIDRGKVIHTADKTGNSYFNEIYFPIDGFDQIRIYCVNWSKKKEKEENYWDALNVIIGGKEFGKFLQTAY